MNKEIILDYFKYLTYNYTSHDYLEIRLMVNDRKVYNIVKLFCEKNNLVSKNNCQIFFKKKDSEKFMKLFEIKEIIEGTKFCYAVNPRKMNNGLIDGTYNCVKNVDFVYFDIEGHGHKVVNKEFLLDYVVGIIEYLQRWNLRHYTLIDSGNGYHLVYRINRTKITDGRKRWYKSFIEMVVRKFNHPDFKIDEIKDFTRILSYPETINPKGEAIVKCKRFSNIRNDINNEFKIGTMQAPKIKQVEGSVIPGDKVVQDSLVWQLLMRDVPTGDIHRTLIFALKLLLKALNIKDYRYYENILNISRGTSHSLDYSKGCEGKTYNKGIVINWCLRNRKWCNKNFPEWRDHKWV